MEGTDWNTAQIRGESEDWEQIVYPVNSPYHAPAVPPGAVGFRGFTLSERPMLQMAASSPEGIQLAVRTEFESAVTEVILEKSTDLLTWTETASVPLVDGKIAVPQQALAAAAVTPREFFRIRYPSAQ